MATTNFSDLLADPSQWDEHRPDHAALMGVVGAGAGADAIATKTAVINTASRSPVVLAFMLTGDDNHIYVGHTPTVFPADVLAATPFDNLTILLIGNDLQRVTPVVLPNELFQRCQEIRVFNTGHMTGAAGHSAAPAVFRFDAAGAGDAEAGEIRARRFFLLPADRAEEAVSHSVDGRFTILGFYNRFIQPGLADADPAIVDAHRPIEQWWRYACTNTAAGVSRLANAPVTSPLPGATMRLNGWVNRVTSSLLGRLGVGGPVLTTAAFTAGVTSIRDTLRDTNDERLQFERDRRNKSFTDKHGAALAERVHRLCDVVDDDHLPDAHRLLAMSNHKSRDYGILAALFVTRAQASDVGITEAAAPIPTTKLVDEVFRSFQVSGTGQSFGQGLTPFAIVCEGHKEAQQVRQMLRKAEMTESGTSVSLADATTLTSSDLRFPTEAYVAMEKLYGWSVVVDIFHGVGTDIARSIRVAVKQIAPTFFRMAAEQATPATGMDLINRVMYDMQQEYYMYLNAKASGPAPAVPTFRELINKVITFRADSLSPLPLSWYLLLDAPNLKSGKEKRAPTTGNNPRSQSGSRKEFYSNADRTLLKRFKDSQFTTISAMTNGKDITIPKHGNKECCLTWAYKGECSTRCSRAAAHKDYEDSTNQKLHAILDKCGVARLQE
jgi:hypothetical protein